MKICPCYYDRNVAVSVDKEDNPKSGKYSDCKVDEKMKIRGNNIFDTLFGYFGVQFQYTKLHQSKKIIATKWDSALWSGQSLVEKSCVQTKSPLLLLGTSKITTT